MGLWSIVVQINFLFGLRCLLTPFLGRHATELHKEDQRHNCHSTAALNCPTQQPRVGTNIGNMTRFLHEGWGWKQSSRGAFLLPRPPLPPRGQHFLSPSVVHTGRDAGLPPRNERNKRKKATKGQDGKTNSVYQSTCTETAVDVQTTDGEIACRTPSEPIPSSFHPVNPG